MDASGSGQATAAPLTLSQREALERLLASRTFERSHRLQVLLKFITDALVDGRVEDIKEQTIGCAVFGRSPGYNQSEDNIVRVTARQLRVKIEEYYRNEGTRDEWLVQIPRGTYVPLFLPRNSLQEHGSVSSLPADSTPSPEIRQAPVRRLWLWCLIGLCCALTVAVALLASDLARVRENGPVTILELLRPVSGRRLNVVASDATLQLYWHLTGKDVPLAEYATRNYLSPDNLPPEIAYKSGAWTYLNIAKPLDYSTFAVLSQLLPALPKDQVSIRHASQLTARDFVQDNAILISSAAANPWVQLFEEKLNFQIRRMPDTQQVIVNRDPRAGEAASYATTNLGSGSFVAYCRLALIPNLSGTGRILLISGPSGVSMEAAASFLTNPATARRLQERFQVKTIQEIRSFEMVLRVVTREGVSESTEIVSYRE